MDTKNGTNANTACYLLDMTASSWTGNEYFYILSLALNCV